MKEQFPATVYVRHGAYANLVADTAISRLLGGMGPDYVLVGEYRLVRVLRAKPSVEWVEISSPSS